MRHLFLWLTVTYVALAALDIATSLWDFTLPLVREANPFGAFFLNHWAVGLVLPKVVPVPLIYFAVTRQTKKSEQRAILLALTILVAINVLAIGNNLLVGFGVIP